MTQYIARIENGAVAQVAVQPDGYQPQDGEALIGPTNTVGIGWSYQYGSFVAPAPDDPINPLGI
ncbi:MAG: hypothetical protein QM682_02790 [Paracoccus sp. (in: a-proteobacteria)]|uniref:hypothetical protein n=1 Tax=Paracoccus sp. TaxID=267 RepID=UPI0039E533A6